MIFEQSKKKTPEELFGIQKPKPKPEPKTVEQKDPLTKLQRLCYELNRRNFTQSEIARKLNRAQSTINQTLKICTRKGFPVKRHKPNSSKGKKPLPDLTFDKT